jgi:hypothetical protein
MASAMDVDRQGSSGGISNSSMITVNNLTYVMEPDLTVAVNATYKKHFFANPEGQPGRANICILNSGADYIDFRRSYLSFDFELTSTGSSDAMVYNGSAPYEPTTARKLQKWKYGANSVDVGFGDGSALNLISRITVNSRSGDEICRVDDVAYISHMITNYCYGQEWKQSVGSAMGITDEMFLWNEVKNANQVKRRFHIPMYLLSGFFNYEKLMPSMLCSGLRIQIEFSPLKEAVVMSKENKYINPNLNYKITNLHIDAKSIQLTDSTQRILNEMSATMGLDLVYTDINTTFSAVPENGGDFHVEVRQACSRALRSWARIRDNNAKDNYLRDSFAADHWLVTSYQWRLGSLYFPQQPVKAYNTDTLTKPIAIDISYSSLVDFNSSDRAEVERKLSDLAPELSNIGETHLQALEMFGKLGGKNSDCTVSFDKFCRGTIPLYSHSGGLGYTLKEIPGDDYVVGELDAFISVADCMSPAEMFDWGFTGQTQRQNHTYPSDNPFAAFFGTGGESFPIATELLKSGWFNSTPAMTRKKRAQEIVKHHDVKITDYGHYYGNHSIIPCNLERSTLFNLSGVPINNSRILGLDLNVRPRLFGQINYKSGANQVYEDRYYPYVTIPTAPKFSHRCDVFLQYIKLARVFMNNVEIEQ